MSNKVFFKQIGGSHYKKYKIQPSRFINENKILFAEGNAIKYICRHQDKAGKQDILKAIHYLEMIIERDYERTQDK
jgi:hypothetical protein